MKIVVYVKNGVEMAVCPPDPEPEEGTFSTWYVGSGDTPEEAYRDAQAACKWHAECTG